jgi:catalase (peroxidase I)
LCILASTHTALRQHHDVHTLANAAEQDPKLSAIAKEYAADNAKFLKAFAAAWTKLMNADRFKGPAGSVC